MKILRRQFKQADALLNKLQSDLQEYRKIRGLFAKKIAQGPGSLIETLKLKRYIRPGQTLIYGTSYDVADISL